MPIVIPPQAKQESRRVAGCRKFVDRGRRLAGYLVVLLGACQPQITELPKTAVTADRIINADAEPGSWLAHGRTYSEQRFSPLVRINTDNVHSLGLAWSFRTGTKRGIEATPLVVDGVMYTTGSWSRVYALDAGTGDLKWRFDPEVPGSAARKACCDVVNRGVAMWGNKLYVGTIDGRLIALDAANGSVSWQVVTVDQSKSYTITGAPRVVNGNVIIGNGGADYGVRGYVSAYDSENGKLLWRFYTVPNNTTGPFEHPELAAAAETWDPNSAWELGGGGTVWDSMAYDPELNLLYVGTGNGAPWPRFLRSPAGGDNLYLSSILALNPDTGRLAWHYQTTPGDSWDYTATQHMILADIEWGGEPRKVLMQAPKNGFFYVLDRTSGELLSAENYAPVNWASGIDMATGRPNETGGDWSEAPVTVRPGPLGGHNWQPMSFNPLTGLVYIPVNLNQHLFVPDKEFRFKSGAWNTGQDLSKAIGLLREQPSAAGGALTQLLAWDPVGNRAAWHVNHTAFKAAGTLSTAGGLVFQGTGGRLVAYDARNGHRLWVSEVGVGIMAPPISYTIGGEQYIAVMAGLGGGSLATQPVNIENDGRVLAYKLGGEASMPAYRHRTRAKPALPELKASNQALEEGRNLFLSYCAVCHGINAASGGMLPDLRHSSREVHDAWMAIVFGGLLADKGMASFADVLQPEEVEKIHAYVVHGARKVGSTVGARKSARTGQRTCETSAICSDRPSAPNSSKRIPAPQ